jgi:hypothetical protein
MEAAHIFKTSRSMPIFTQCKDPKASININHGILSLDKKMDEFDSLFYDGLTMKQF